MKSSSSRSTSRQPFGTRDPNTKGSVAASLSSVAKVERNIDMQRIVRSALVMSGASSSASGSKASSASSPAFRIYDESSNKSTATEHPPRGHSKPPQCRSLTEDALVRRTKALTIADPSPRASELLRSPGAMSALSATSSVVSNEAETLLRMIERLDTVLDITQSRKGMYSQHSPRHASGFGPQKWVTRYVDYTSKYGLGFLLNDGSSGVYFNDSTKIALEADGETFQYIERRKADDNDALSARRTESTTETCSLSSHPDYLTKKVTLLKHFRNYLLEQLSEDDQLQTSASQSDAGSCISTNLVYVKKWVRTKHAILFRLSNLTIQVVFYDQSEILLTPDDRYITYVDKNRKRMTYNFTDELVGSSPDLEKRLKYTKEIMNQLMSGRPR